MTNLGDGDLNSALKRIIESDLLSGSPRLCEFLSYVVAEAQAGRADQIRAKTIGMDVYGHDANESGDRENVVRVDARRLRRKLADYYAGSGVNDPIHISLPTGGYAPRFERTAEAVSRSFLTSTRGKWVAASAGAVVLAAAITVQFWPSASDQPTDGRGAADRSAERQALFDKSPAALQAVNLAEQARAIIFPAVDVARLAAALQMFEQASELDAGYFGGYAGAAQVMATQAALSPPGDARDALMQQARERAKRAADLNPSSGWSQSARAWAAFVERDFDAANKLSIRARELSPDDPHVLEFDSLIALFSGRFERVLGLEENALAQRHDATRFIFRNTFASAHFHVGEYAKAVELFEKASAEGGPVSPITVSYLIAAQQMSGDEQAARKSAEEFKSAWPGARVDLLLLSIFSEKALARQVIEPMLQAGWTPADG